MTDATLSAFRDLADAMSGPAPKDWEWIGQHMSQRMFQITEARAKEYASLYGGTARKMPSTEEIVREIKARGRSLRSASQAEGGAR